MILSLSIILRHTFPLTSTYYAAYNDNKPLGTIQIPGIEGTQMPPKGSGLPNRPFRALSQVA